MWLEADRARAPLGDFPPRWADAFGDGEFGLWTDFVLKGVRQRMRWIEPGRFVTGSPAEERQRIDDKDIGDWADQRESPAHLVTISLGFWLAETPCTQALWGAVLGGNNPSRFADGHEALQRPVAPVSRDDAQRFLEALAQAKPHSQLALPSEAEWRNTPAAPARRLPIGGAKRGTRTWPMLPATFAAPARSSATGPAPGPCTTFTAMSGSGAPIPS